MKLPSVSEEVKDCLFETLLWTIYAVSSYYVYGRNMDMVNAALLLEILWIIALVLCCIPFVGHVLYYYVAKDYIYPWFAAQTGLKWSILLTAVLAINEVHGIIITTESTIALLNKAGFRL